LGACQCTQWSSTVSIAAGQLEAARKSLYGQVVRRVSKAPGFVKGYWAASLDARSGLSFILFNTKPDAENAVNMVRNTPPPPNVTLSGVEVREVIAEA